MITSVSLLALLLTRIKVLNKPVLSGLTLSVVLLLIFFDYQYRGILNLENQNTHLLLFPAFIATVGALSIWLKKPLYELVLPFVLASVFLNFSSFFNPYIYSFVTWIVLISTERQKYKFQTLVNALFPVITYVIYLIFENGLMNVSTLENVAYFNSDLFFVPLVETLSFTSMVLLIYFIAKQTESFLELSKPLALAKIFVLLTLLAFYRKNFSTDLGTLVLVLTVFMNFVLNRGKNEKAIAVFVVLATFFPSLLILYPVVLILFCPFIWSKLPRLKSAMLNYLPIMTVLISVASLSWMTIKDLSTGEIVICLFATIHVLSEGRFVKASLREASV